ncbi:biopolymer transporter ExbD [Pseudomonas plecoglossicida]|uniref:Biopolymer transporter ExbD n=1 Tax=Pseudomonas plecoglossicida TaxID=70775 RepID=A0A2A3M6Y9_PSEDL|nr:MULTISPECIES: biopolymer transporter ExbD [Pseudomonas]GJB78170.1 biopolymer transporter ExbD [Aeromonas caviae]PBJ95895.1 biopolymer transporter ExbD [Pseudomonas plecoglossicida]PLU84639.1 biopolymer transporter ExbD [Pseudomonas plecoglossicida]PLU89835.1 biopolymer transporter ExbD [Pseudomonas plecoglossicida]PLU98354.1 biopolymer transporter ExbD [Pseudomonas plecoglossicida]
MKFRRNRQRENVDINLASLIDVVFVLLLFFVVTTTFTRETQLRVELPEAASAEPAAPDQGKLVEITISAEGVYSVNNHLLPKSDLATLSEAIERESGGDNKLPLAISADGRTPHQAVVTAMDAAGKLGFSQLRMTTVEAAQDTP